MSTSREYDAEGNLVAEWETPDADAPNLDVAVTLNTDTAATVCAQVKAARTATTQAKKVEALLGALEALTAELAQTP